MAYYPANFYARRFTPARYYPPAFIIDPPIVVPPTPISIYGGRGGGGGGGGSWSAPRSRVPEKDTTLAPVADTLQSEQDLITFITVFLNTIYA